MPNYKITTVPATRHIPADDITVPIDSYNLGQKIKAAIAIGIFAAIIIAVGASALFVLAKINWRDWVNSMLSAIAVGFMVASVLGIWWSFEAAYRAWRLDDKVRKRMWKIEDKERQAQAEAAKKAEDDVRNKDDDDGNPWTLNDTQRLDLLAVRVFDRAYNKNLSVTRDDMCQAGLCTQDDWNLVNKVLKALKLKSKYKMVEEMDFKTAWATWEEQVKIEQGHIWALKQNGEWKALERIV